MSKTLDTVNMKIYLEEFYSILEKNDLFISSVLRNQHQIKVKIERTIGESFKIHIRRINNGREFQNTYKNNGESFKAHKRRKNNRREFQNRYKKKE